MPCFKQAYEGLNPRQLDGVHEREAGELLELWSKYQQRRFPAGVADLDNRFDLLSIDSDAAGCISSFFHAAATLDDRRARLLRSCEESLATAVPSLEGEPREYFAELLDLVRGVRASLSDQPPNRAAET